MCKVTGLVVSQFENPKNKKECHASESWHPDQIARIPAFAGMTLKMKLRHHRLGGSVLIRTEFKGLFAER